MYRLRFVVPLVLALNLPMLAQSGKAELFGGYSLERIAGGCGTDYRCGTNDPGATTNLNGWITSLTGYFHKSLGVSVQFSGNYGNAGVASGGGGLSAAHRYAFQVGPAYGFHFSKASAFAHALFGGVNQHVSQGTINGIAPSYTAFLWSVGGGIDLKASKNFAIRFAQIDYERHLVPAEGASGPSSIATSGFRYSAGVVVRF